MRRTADQTTQMQELLRNRAHRELAKVALGDPELIRLLLDAADELEAALEQMPAGLRDEIAIGALQGLLASPFVRDPEREIGIVRRAYVYADLVLEERKKTKAPR